MARNNDIPDETVTILIREEMGECMPIDIWYEGNVWVFRPFGRIDSGHSADLDSALSEGISQGMRLIVLDLTDTSYISSSGLRAVIKAAKTVKTVHGMIILCGMKEPVKEVFRLSGLLKIFSFCQTVQEAIKTMQE